MTINYKKLFFVIIVIIKIVIICACLFGFRSNTNLKMSSKVPFYTIRDPIKKPIFSKTADTKTKYILYWIRMWNSKTFAFNSEGFELFKNCEFNNCFATHNRSLRRLDKFDAIIFHAAQYNTRHHGIPNIRHPNQRYIFTTMESPTRAYPDNLNKFRSFYNWTMTYRYDSDIFLPYGYIIKNSTNYTMPEMEKILQKNKLVAWFVSNCYTINRRQILFRNLQRLITIDVFGVCGPFVCPKKMHESAPKCYDSIEENYKFYLSFENSHCKDYVTEKLYRLLERNIVPIVYGAVDYRKVAPPNSVIIADEYSSAKDLVDYILHLDKNVTEYLKFFEWKKSYYVKRDGNVTVCKLCQMLHDSSQPPKIYDDIFLWWLGKNHSYCKLGISLPKISTPDFIDVKDV